MHPTSIITTISICTAAVHVLCLTCMLRSMASISFSGRKVSMRRKRMTSASTVLNRNW